MEYSRTYKKKRHTVPFSKFKFVYSEYPQHQLLSGPCEEYVPVAEYQQN